MGLHTRISAALAAVVVGVTHVLGGWTPAMTTLVTIVVLDMVSGFSRAAIQQRLSSKESWAGIGKKVMMFVVICLAAQVDRLLDANNVIRNATVIFYCVSESLSVLENVVAAGMPVPDVIRDALAQLLERKGKPPEE
jgi:toxin secretion/phage lysis holin